MLCPIYGGHTTFQWAPKGTEGEVVGSKTAKNIKIKANISSSY